MQEIINGRKYNIETAHKVGYWNNGQDEFGSSFVAEELYRKRNGEYFLYSYNYDSYFSLDNIEPVTIEDARKWAEEHLSTEEYEAEFGEVSEDDPTTARLSVEISLEAYEAIKDTAAKRKVDMGSMVEELAKTLR
jgi:hypothetical protein